MSDPLIETENPNDTEGRNPGDPTISLDADGTHANEPALFVATSPVNPAPTPQSDPAHVPSPYQPEDELEVLKENARLREVALQAENRLVGKAADRTPHVDPALVVTPSNEPPSPVNAPDPNAPLWPQA